MTLVVHVEVLDKCFRFQVIHHDPLHLQLPLLEDP
jgi:hypothetical protein